MTKKELMINLQASTRDHSRHQHVGNVLAIRALAFHRDSKGSRGLGSTLKYASALYSNETFEKITSLTPVAMEVLVRQFALHMSVQT
jgi:hypothetical protein